ncbi:MAG TPA: Na+/H+ antiporter NhaC family protein [Oscillospiraceae bacterium]|nr:Na+/H+ antiporter NhaC family protein [Oscillospiraceae bacterium]HPF56256.1 Na+/H+ antiporter NhaC family protein [Clostridiales bacterium]HPK34502.1 Na+/H+ antiporter NhaC family protein [Oscillospiraceae bacterium]HPR74730.1 Na+/H+ antiporter NhaC family protein [Oscillospiraceae bacterium]
MYATFWALVPPIVAIALALLTKEVYISLFIGILTGALFYSNFNPMGTVTSIFEVMSEKAGDPWNVGILIFLVILGIMVSLMTKAGGSAAYGRWAAKKIKTKAGASLATVGLGVLIFIDDYFNCLTVGSVMRPVTDKHKISRAKLAYIIDATAAPVCIIAPISSWAAAVTSSTEGTNIDGFAMFIKAIPYNFYAILTIVMLIMITLLNFDFGSMKRHEVNAANGDLFTTDARPYTEEQAVSEKGKVLDLVIPVVLLIVCCILGMIYTGGFFEGASFIEAFAGSDASVGLVLGSFAALVLTFLLYIPRKVISFKEFAASIPEGFKAMVPAILILVFAWTLSGFCRDCLGAGEFVGGVVGNSATASAFLPAILFLVALGLAFSTGTSWGTFGILIPIVIAIFPEMSEILVITISACLAGAVCGDHVSPISDTTIMASAGAQCDHINHVSTQMPYALLVAGVSFVCYIAAGFLQNAVIMLPISIVLMGGLLLIMYFSQKKKSA